MVMDDWGANLRFYSRRDAQDRLNTILTDEGLKYAEQISDNTTLVMEMDWLMWPGQLQVRKLRDEIDTADLLGAEYQLLRDRAMQFGPRQRRFLLSYLFEKRCQANRAVVAGSKWIQALKGKLGRVTGSTFHDVYATVVKILTSEDADDRLTVPEKMFAWSLLKHLKNELRRDAEAWRIKHGGGKFSVALASIGGLSFRHLRAMNAKIGALSLAPEAMFLLREAAKSKYKELKLRARTTSFIQESEAYLLDVLDGAVDADPDRIEDLRVAARMAHSAAHLGELIDRLASQEQLV